MQVTEKNTTAHPGGLTSHSAHDEHAQWRGSLKSDLSVTPHVPPVAPSSASAVPRTLRYQQLAAEVMSHYADDYPSRVHATEDHLGQARSLPRSSSSTKSASSSKSDEPIATPDTGPHEAPYEREAKLESPFFAKQDRYNRPEVKSRSNKRGGQVRRPGVRVGGEANGHDLFTIKRESAPRFRLKSDNPYLGHGQYAAEQIDTIEKGILQVHGKQSRKGKLRLMLNPARPRRLVLNHGKPPEHCVLVFLSGDSHDHDTGKAGATAWMRVADLDGKAKDIKLACTQAAKHWNPKAASKSEMLDSYEFRPFDDPVAMHDSQDDSGYIFPNCRGTANKASDYLQRSNDRKKEHAYINICQSLPQKDAPPVPIDVARPGDCFFIPRNYSFHREIAVYSLNPERSTRWQMWVYGFMGKLVNGQWVADRSRFGWVPLRTVKRLNATPSKPNAAASPDSQSLAAET